MTSLPNDIYRICPNYNEWYDKDTKGKESNCNWCTLRDLIQNITINEEHLKTCVTTQYLGEMMVDLDNTMTMHKDNHTRIYYKFHLPIKTKVYEEYLITDAITLIGSVGGTLGLFISFSMSNMVNFIMNFLESTIKAHFSRNLKKESLEKHF